MVISLPALFLLAVLYEGLWVRGVGNCTSVSEGAEYVADQMFSSAHREGIAITD